MLMHAARSSLFEHSYVNPPNANAKLSDSNVPWIDVHVQQVNHRTFPFCAEENLTMSR